MLIRLLTLSAVVAMLAAPAYADPTPLPAMPEGFGAAANFFSQAKSFADDNAPKMKQLKDMAKTMKHKKTDQPSPPDQPPAGDSPQPQAN